MAKKPIKITEVVLRDAHQSLLATRMTMDEMRPILPEMDKIPYFSVECWGGATFDYDQVRPGGMVAVITTKGTLDKANPTYPWVKA